MLGFCCKVLDREVIIFLGWGKEKPSSKHSKINILKLVWTRLTMCVPWFEILLRILHRHSLSEQKDRKEKKSQRKLLHERMLPLPTLPFFLIAPSVARAIPLVMGDQVQWSPFSPENYLVLVTSRLLLDISGMTCL